MRVRFWGTRGSIATPGPGTVRFGGNTSCVEITTAVGVRFVIDCGTGARPLGLHLMTAPKPLTANILLSHVHWDHIQGFPFFTPLFIPGNRIRVYGPAGAGGSLSTLLAGQMEFTYFPVSIDQLASQLSFHELAEGVHDIDGVRVVTQFLNHPAPAIGYRIEADGCSALYLCDHEPYSGTLWRGDAEPGRMESILHLSDRRHAQFMEGADLVIHDAQYTPEEYPAKRNWGHSTYRYVVEMAAMARVRRVALTHHDPLHDDEFVACVEERAREAAGKLGCALEVCCAAEGMEIELARDVAQPAASATVTSSSPARAARILIGDDDPDVRLLARRILEKQGYQVAEAKDGVETLRSVREDSPDLLILDILMPGLDGIGVLQALRSDRQTADLPVLLLTSQADEPTERIGFDAGATDFLTKPFSLPQLAARVQACLARANAVP